MHKIMSDYYGFQELPTIQYWDIKCYMCLKDYTFINIDASQSYLTVASSIWHSATSEYLNTSIFISILFVLLLKSLSKAFKGSFLSPPPASCLSGLQKVTRRLLISVSPGCRTWQRSTTTGSVTQRQRCAWFTLLPWWQSI